MALTTTKKYDAQVEDRAIRQDFYGMSGRGTAGYPIYQMSYHSLPSEAVSVLEKIVRMEAFSHPQDGSYFSNRNGDLPVGVYLEFTVPTPGVGHRAMRRFVIRSQGQVFFTACHYERVGVSGGGTPEQKTAARGTATLALDPREQNGFYYVTGMDPALRSAISRAMRWYRTGA